jgi:hypothetical protein
MYMYLLQGALIFSIPRGEKQIKSAKKFFYLTKNQKQSKIDIIGETEQRIPCSVFLSIDTKHRLTYSLWGYPPLKPLPLI